VAAWVQQEILLGQTKGVRVSKIIFPTSSQQDARDHQELYFKPFFSKTQHASATTVYRVVAIHRTVVVASSGIGSICSAPEIDDFKYATHEWPGFTELATERASQQSRFKPIHHFTSRRSSCHRRGNGSRG